MRTLLEIYFAINILCAGYELHNKMTWARDGAEKIMAILTCLFYIFFLIPYFIFIFLKALLGWAIWQPLNNHLQVGFLFEFYLTKRWHEVSEDVLYNINKRATLRKEGDNRIGSRIFIHCINLVNTRHNYTFTEKPADF
jgi:hypothetical protein